MEPFELIRSRRKTLALEITKDCRVLVRAPRTLSRERIDAFVASHQDWIARHLERQRLRAASAPPAPTPAEIEALKARARGGLPPKNAYWRAKMGVTPPRGSCSAKNSLCFSCFLMNSPEDAIELVVVHELCHIRVKNHGPAFYSLLEHYLPDYRERKQHLR